MSTAFIASTGQTVTDLLALNKLYQIYAKGNSTTAAPSLPALTDPNYRPSNDAPVIITVTILTILLEVLFVSCRIQTRISSLSSQPGLGKRRLLPEDWALLAGFAFALVNQVFLLIGTICWQFAWKIFDMHLSSLQIGIKFIFAYTLIFGVSAYFIRLSIIFFVRGLYGHARPAMQRLCDALAVFSTLYMIASRIALAFECEDPHNSLDVFASAQANVEGKCHHHGVTLVIIILHIALDWSAVLLALYLVFNIRVMSTRKRVEGVVMFSLGLVACSIATARFWYTGLIIPKDISSLNANRTIANAILTQVELCAGIMAACLPSVKIVMAQFTKRTNTNGTPKSLTYSSDGNDLESGSGVVDNEQRRECKPQFHPTALEMGDISEFVTTTTMTTSSETLVPVGRTVVAKKKGRDYMEYEEEEEDEEDEIHSQTTTSELKNIPVITINDEVVRSSVEVLKEA